MHAVLNWGGEAAHPAALLLGTNAVWHLMEQSLTFFKKKGS